MELATHSLSPKALTTGNVKEESRVDANTPVPANVSPPNVENNNCVGNQIEEVKVVATDKAKVAVKETTGASFMSSDAEESQEDSMPTTMKRKAPGAKILTTTTKARQGTEDKEEPVAASPTVSLKDKETPEEVELQQDDNKHEGSLAKQKATMSGEDDITDTDTEKDHEDPGSSSPAKNITVPRPLSTADQLKVFQSSLSTAEKLEILRGHKRGHKNARTLQNPARCQLPTNVVTKNARGYFQTSKNQPRIRLQRKC